VYEGTGWSRSRDPWKQVAWSVNPAEGESRFMLDAGTKKKTADDRGQGPIDRGDRSIRLGRGSADGQKSRGFCSIRNNRRRESRPVLREFNAYKPQRPRVGEKLTRNRRGGLNKEVGGGMGTASVGAPCRESIMEESKIYF